SFATSNPAQSYNVGNRVSSELLIGVLAAAILLLAIFPLARHAAAGRGSDGTAHDLHEAEAWLDNFSLAAYEPMLRLASRHDRQFLTSARNRLEAGRYRRKQRALLREYMRTLSRDFNRLYSIASTRAAHARNGESGVSFGLLEQQMAFIFLMWSIE